MVVPSIPTRDFLEPWGLVVNEAFHQGVPVIATDAVGAAAGGLVQHERTGLVVPAGDARALAAALRRLHDDPALRARLGANAREAVRAHSHAAWADGHERGRCRPRERRMPPASVFSMLRLALACLVLGLLVAVPAANAASTTQILRDCADDGVLQGDYTPSELRNARQNIPTDTDEYTDCRDVLARAAAAGVSAKGGGSGGTAGPAAPAAPAARASRPRRPGHARGPRRSSARPAPSRRRAR